MEIVIEAQHACTPTPIGICRYAISLIRALAKRNQNEYALTFFDHNREAGNRAHMQRHFGDLNLPFHECNEISYYDAFTKPMNKTYGEYTKTSGDVYHFLHYSKFPESAPGAMVVTDHDVMALIHPEWFEPRIVEYSRFFVSRIRRTHPLILSNSECSKMDLMEYGGVSSSDIMVVPHAYDSESCYPKSNPEALRKLGVDSPYFLYFGTIDIRKNVSTLLKAFRIVAEKYHDISLVIAGTRSYNGGEVWREIADFSMRDRLILLDGATDSERRALYSGAIAFIFPSLYEGFGVPVLEAFACGCPLIASNVSALPEVAGDAAILIDPLDKEEISLRMEQLLNDGKLRSGLIAKGLARAKEFSWDKTAEMTEQAYEIAIGRA